MLGRWWASALPIFAALATLGGTDTPEPSARAATRPGRCEAPARTLQVDARWTAPLDDTAQSIPPVSAEPEVEDEPHRLLAAAAVRPPPRAALGPAQPCPACDAAPASRRLPCARARDPPA